MSTLSQRRAACALRWKDKDFGGKKEGNVISGFPMLIRADGLLPALAYAVEKKKDGTLKNKGECQIASALVDHLTHEGILKESRTPMDMVNELALGKDASQLRRATAESLAFLNYLKRFVS